MENDEPTTSGKNDSPSQHAQNNFAQRPSQILENNFLLGFSDIPIGVNCFLSFILK